MDTLPFVSVVIPVYNDPDGIENTLKSITEQSYLNDNHEVIIVDNDSTDDTRRVAERVAERQSNVRVIVEEEVQGSYAARNRGIDHAEGEILAFLDANMIVEGDWLESAVESIKRRKADYMACDVELYVDGGRETIAGAYNRRTGFPIEQYIERNHFAPTCCLFVRQWVVEEHGPFDARLVSGGDVEFGNRVHDAGIELEYEPTVTAYHPVRSSIRELLQKSFRVGKGSGQLARYYPDRFGHLGIINPIALLARVLFSSSGDDETLGSGNQPDSLKRRVAFRIISVLEDVWYLGGRASVVIS